jgi:hypothetical protein
MSVWFRQVSGLNTDTMREIAEAAGVSWSVESIVYRGNGIGFADGDSADETALQDAAEPILGYRPVVIDTPPEPDTEA